MNYIELKNQFWQLRRSKRITNLQADLYDFLLHESSSRGIGSNWENPFQCSNELIMSSIEVAKSSLQDARNGLQQLGLIKVTPGIRNMQHPVYFITGSKADSRPRNRQETGHETGHETGKKPAHYKEETKQKPKRNETSKSHSGANAPVTEKKELVFWNEFISEWNDWYHATFGNKYMYLEKDFAHLKRIYQFLQKRAEDKKFEFTEQNLLAAFKFFLKKAWDKDQWLRNNFSLPNILSQFNQIVNDERNTNPKNSTATGSAVDTRSILEKINGMSDQT